ncbi:hypothetical protein GCM10027048_25400 [Hymenobacter coalescens]
MLVVASCRGRNDEQPENLASPRVLRFSPQAAAPGATVTILGSSFSATPANNVVKFTAGEAKASFVRKGTPLDTLKVTVPPNAATGPLTLTVHKQAETTHESFVVVSGRWTRKADFPGGAGMYGTGFTLAGKTYAMVPGTNELWAYDAAANTWVPKAPHPVGTVALSSRAGELLSFVAGSYAYVGVYLYNYPVDEIRFYRYDPATDQWSHRSSPGRINAHHGAVFGLNGRGYLVDTDKYTKGVLEYDPAANTWTRKRSFPGAGRYLSTYFSLGGKGYLGGGDTGTSSALLTDFWEYDPVADSWTRKADLPVTNYEPNGFTAGGKGYAMGGNMLYAYNPATNTWAREADFEPLIFTGKVHLSAPGKGYVLRGRDVGNGLYNQFWEFSPQ